MTTESMDNKSDHKVIDAKWDYRPEPMPNPNKEAIDPSTGWPVSIIKHGTGKNNKTGAGDE